MDNPAARHDPNFQVYFHFLQTSSPSPTSPHPNSSHAIPSSKPHTHTHNSSMNTTSKHKSHKQSKSKSKCTTCHGTIREPTRTQTLPTLSTSGRQAYGTQQQAPDGEGKSQRQNSMPLPPIHSLLAMDDPVLGGGWNLRRQESWDVRYSYR